MKRFVVLYQEWEESERGWGVRPDGYSLHVDEAHHKAYVAKYMKDQHKYFTSNGMADDAVPDEYSRVSGPPIHVNVTAKVHAQLVARGGDYVGWWNDGAKVDAAHNFITGPKGLPGSEPESSKSKPSPSKPKPSKPKPSKPKPSKSKPAA